MKQLLFLLLFPCLAMAQYQGNGNQKITLGEQTTADGLVWRGIRADTTSKIVPFSDTSAYIILDTVEKTLWLYKAGQIPKWQQVGGSTLDTATMLLPYYRAGRNTIIQAADVPTLNQNTTGSAATLTTGRTIQTNLASTSSASFNGSANITPGVTGTLPVANGGTNLTTFTAANRIPYASSATALTTSSGLTFDGTNFTTTGKVGIGTSSPYSKLTIHSTASTTLGLNAQSGLVIGQGGSTNDLIQIGFNQEVASTYSPAVISYLITNSSSSTFGDILFSTRTSTSDVAPTERMRITSGGNVGIGTTSPQSGYRLHVVDSVYVGGNVSASAYTTRSDYDLKDEIQNISYGINEVMQMQPVKYTYKSNGSTQLGFIAQDLGVITPEVVSFEDKMSVYYNALIPILTKAIQEQQALIKALEQRILTLENK